MSNDKKSNRSSPALRAGRLSSAPAVGGNATLMWMTIVLLMAFAFGANGLNTEPIWTDELYSLTNMGVFDPPYSPQDIIDSITTYSSDHVPFYYLIGAAWAQLAGWTQVSMRLFSVLAGSLMIAWLYRLAADMFCWRTGLLAALLMATSAYVILFFHDIRMYTLLLMLTAMHSWLYWRIAHRHQVTRLTWLLFLLTAVILLYTHVFALLVFAQLGLYHLIFAPRSRRWLHLLFAWVLSALSFLPYLATLIAAVQMAAVNPKVVFRAASISELIPTFFRLLANGSGLLAVILVCLIVLVLWRRGKPGALGFTLVALGTLLMIVLLNEVVSIIPTSRMRYFLILWIPFVTVCAYSLTNLPHWRPITILFVLLWLSAGFHFYRSQELLDYIGGMMQARHHPPMHQYVAALAGKVRQQDYLLGFSHLNTVNDIKKFGDSITDYYTRTQLGIDGAFIPDRWHDLRLQNDIPRKIDRHPFLLFTYNPRQLTPNFAEVSQYMRENYQECKVIIDRDELFVQRYVDPLAGCDHEYAPIHYDNGIVIVDKFGEYDSDNDRVRVITGWEVANEEQLYQYNVSIQIIEPDWQMVQQRDRHLYNKIVTWYDAELPTDSLPSGDYRVFVIVYDRETGKKVQGTDLASGEKGNILPILHFRVEP